MDHFLGKETVQIILAMRFANPIFEPIWNRAYIDHLAVTVAKDIGVGHRTEFTTRSPGDTDSAAARHYSEIYG